MRTKIVEIYRYLLKHSDAAKSYYGRSDSYLANLSLQLVLALPVLKVLYNLFTIDRYFWHPSGAFLTIEFGRFCTFVKRRKKHFDLQRMAVARFSVFDNF